MGTAICERDNGRKLYTFLEKRKLFWDELVFCILLHFVYMRWMQIVEWDFQYVKIIIRIFGKQCTCTYTVQYSIHSSRYTYTWYTVYTAVGTCRCSKRVGSNDFDIFSGSKMASEISKDENDLRTRWNENYRPVLILDRGGSCTKKRNCREIDCHRLTAAYVCMV